jgi:IS66 Orf2 like protein
MLQLTTQSRIFVATEPVDFRKGIDGLAAVCRRALGDNPLSGALYVFRNRAGTTLKILCYDGQGFWLSTTRHMHPGLTRVFGVSDDVWDVKQPQGHRVVTASRVYPILQLWQRPTSRGATTPE